MKKNIKTNNHTAFNDSNLLDCYRIALDFGMPAALRAFESMNNDDVIPTSNSDNPDS